METIFINGGEYVDKATYIQTRDRLGKAFEKIVELEAEIERLSEALQQVWDCEEPNACPNCKLLAREVLKEVE